MNPFLTSIAVYVATIIFFYAVSYVPSPKISQLSSFAARSLVGIGSIIFCATYGVFGAIFLRIIGKPGLSQWIVARGFKYTMWWFAGVWFDVVEGKEYLETRPAVFVGNHQTELDVLFLGTVFPKYCSVTAKKSLKWTPFLGQFMAISGTVFIDRANRKSAVAAFDGVAKHMHTKRQSVYIFPEGTRSYFDKPDMLPFKKGAFHLAVQAQVPIVPIVAANYSNILNIRKRIFRAGRIPVKVLPPIETKGMETKDVDRLCIRVREEMMKVLVDITNVEKHKENGSTVVEAMTSGADVGKKRVVNQL